MMRAASRICWSDGENARPCQSATMVLLESPRPSPTRPGAKWLRLAALMPRTTGVRVCTGRTAEPTWIGSVWLAISVMTLIAS